MDESRPNLAGWKAVALLYSALHGANHWFATQTERGPENRAGRNRRAGREPPRIFDDYRNLYGLSMHARCRGGFRTHDSRRAHALAGWAGWRRAFRAHSAPSSL